MGLLSLLKGSQVAAARSSDEALVERARTSARRRLIGAVVLLGIGVVAFPLIFETQPRPIPVDIPIEIPRKEGQAPVVLPPARPAATAASKPPAVVAESKAEAPREPAPPAASAPTAPTVAKVESRAATKPEPKPEVKAEVKAEVKPETRAEAKPEPKPQAKPASAVAAKLATDAVAGGRFVVQVGAFAEAGAVRDARGRVEKLGLATYTQSVETPGGARTRVRVGPFATREEADKAAAKLKAAGLPGAVLAL